MQNGEQYESKDNNYCCGISHSLYEELKSEIRYMEASLYAICDAIYKHGIAEKILLEASSDGRKDLISFYAKYKNDEELRLLYDIHRKYSKNEIAVIKSLLDRKM